MHAHAKDGARNLRVHVVTVSTSRTAGNDVSGPLVRELVVEAGHVVTGHTLVPDDPDAVGAALDGALAGDAQVVVLTGGTGISARDCTPRVVAPRLDRVLPGFGELFRMLSWQEVGAAAMLSTAIGGIARGKPVFALPGSPGACRLALQKLILPELGHLVSELAKEPPLPTKASGETTTAPASSSGARARVLSSADAPPVEPAPPPELVSQIHGPARPEEEEIGSGWRAGLRALGGVVDRGARGEIPERFEKIASVLDVLHAAGDRAVVRLPDGRAYTAFGYPDLVRNPSKVLLVRDAEPYGEVVALHRWPKRVGVCAEGDDGVVPSAELDPGPVAEEITGVPYAGPGQLFAVEGGSIYLLQGRKVAQFDGRNVADGWPVASALGTLLLHWSQR